MHFLYTTKRTRYHGENLATIYFPFPRASSLFLEKDEVCANARFFLLLLSVVYGSCGAVHVKARDQTCFPFPGRRCCGREGAA